ncbi:hypothetical protein [Empedobacter tilapiae]|uniref:Uncharacterized protein n=1 Tax=Empedobacter tilapiae TaxID=2491114 RepID=A0A4Z1BK53_9FLAO|nr:hypothetical protein [Empedobacter tilapiae]TGN26090.1 hypothetical protein E4J94_12100 [Empedobacter tilapiae]
MDQDKEIIKKSKKRLQKLKLLSKFFDKADLINIIIKTELIQSYFNTKSPNDLDINKLELFHLQYTDSLIVLLEKIKKQKEANILAIYTEIDKNEEYIESYSNNDVGGFHLDKKFHNSFVSDYLKSFYYNMVEVRMDFDSKIIRNFSNNYAMNYYRRIDQINYLLSLPKTKYYEFENVDVEKKLLGKLNLNNFMLRFVCGYNSNNQIFELFKITNTEDQFIWNLQTNEFYFLAKDIMLLLDTSPNVSSQKNIVDDLVLRNKELELKSEHMKTDLSEDILSVLQKYKETLENQDIVNQVIDVDEEMNILNAMLDLNLNNKLQ